MEFEKPKRRYETTIEPMEFRQAYKDRRMEENSSPRFESNKDDIKRYEQITEGPPSSSTFDYEEEYIEEQPQVLLPKPRSPQELPKRPRPESFHSKIENQLDFEPVTATTSEPFYETEALDPPPVYRPREKPSYYKYDPMTFAPPPQNDNRREFPGLSPFEDIDRGFSEASLDIPRSTENSRRGAGRALQFEPVDIVPNHYEMKPYQFAHHDAPHTYKAGHSRGNYQHHVKNREDHQGPHHLQEVRKF